jgi:hypothetical protein
MTTVLEECIAEERRSVVRFLLARGLDAKDIHKEMFHIYGEKRLQHKAVHSWIEKLPPW